MLFDSLERAWTVVNANFQTDWNTLAGIKGVANTGFTAVTIVKRESAESMIEGGLAEPSIGIYGLGGNTQMAKGGTGGRRDSINRIVAELVNVGDDPSLIQTQVELAIEVLIKDLCERIGQGAATTYAGGLEPGSVEYEVTDAYKRQQAPNYICVGTVTVPIYDEDPTT